GLLHPLARDDRRRYARPRGVLGGTMPSLTMPNVGEGVAEGTVTRWLKHEGDAVVLDELVVEIETDKAVVEIPSPFGGTLTRILVEEGETVPIGAPLAEFEASGAVSTEAGASKTSETPQPVSAASSTHMVRSAQPAASRASNGAAPPGAPPRRHRQYSPVVLKLAAEHDIDLSLVRGTGIE